jgi:hypothetical protein
MVGLNLDSEYTIKQEQYKDLLRDVEHYRLMQIVAQPRSKPWHKAIGALRGALIRLRQGFSILEQPGRAQA